MEMPATHGLLGRILRANDDASRRFGPNTAEVEAFIHSVAHLTPWQWRQVIAARSLVSTVTKEDAALPADSVKAIQAAIRSTEGRLAEPMLRAGEALLLALEKRTDEKLVAAWQATSALVMRHRTSPLKFAAHYAPFVALIPVSGFDALDPAMTRFLHAVQSLTRERCELLAKRWRLDPDASRALLQAVAKSRYLKSEEAAALIALRTIPAHLAGDAGWGAVRTVAHGGRVLGARAELTREQAVVLWAPLEAAISLASVEEAAARPARARVRAAVARATTAIKAQAAPRSVTVGLPKRLGVAQPKAPAPYGPNSTEVSAFIKGIVELTAIQWLRILDRRQLVASVTREGTAEPAGAVRALLAGIKGTGSLDTYTRCRAFAAVEHAAHAFESKVRTGGGDAAEFYGAFARIVPLGYIAEDGFAKLVGALSPHDWIQVANSVPAVSEEVVAPLINAGAALQDFLAGRSDDEAVAAWLALTALVRRQQPVLRYVSALGRLSASQCKVLAQPWEVEDDMSSALSRAVADGGAKEAEEAAALAAVVTVPMRLSGGDGWAAAKTAAFGGRVIGARARLSLEQIQALWKPIQQAIPLASLGAVARSPRRLSSPEN